MKTSMAFNRDIKTVDMLAARADLSGPRVSLLIHCRDGVQVVPLVPSRRTIVGRGLPSDILIQEPSLSRQHAHFTLEEGQVWVEDLESTNGTRVNGRRVTRCAISPSDVVLLGGVTICVHVLAPGEGPQWVLSGHDNFVPELENELARTKTFGRQLGLLMLRPARRSPGHLSRWCPRVQKMLRPFDRIALYSTDDVEIFLPETTAAEAMQIAQSITGQRGQEDPPLLCGIGIYPDSASSAEELIEVTRRAALRASVQRPVQMAPTGGSATTDSEIRPVVADDEVVVRSASMHAIFHTVRRLAESTIPVLISGETGTGKEIVARAIHDSGPRRNKPLRCINCAAIPQQLIESALFGHERGAFTGADQRAKGVFEEADGGTVLLDEIGELSPAAQGALLRVLETKRITRVGSHREFAVDVRILAATNRNLEKMCEQQAFRWDLLYRLNAMTLKLPPLRERPEEIESLTSHFIRQANSANGCEVWGIAPEALALLCRYNWPGNVRELRNVIERAVVLTRRGAISVDELSERVRAMQLDYRGRRPTGAAPSGEHLAAANSADAPRFPIEDHTDVFDLLDIPLAADEAERGDPTDHDPAVARRTPTASDERRPSANQEPSFHASVERLQRLLIIMALDRCDGNQARAARWLGLPLRTLFYKIKAYGLRDREPTTEDRRAAAALGGRWTIDDNFKDWVQSHEARLIREALVRAGGNKAEAARQLRIAHRTLSSKIRQYKIES